MKEANIKTIIPIGQQEYYAAYLPDKRRDIESRIEKIVCWSLLSFESDSPDEVVGQIIIKDQVVEATYPDSEDGFGDFLGYFTSAQDAATAIEKSQAASESDADKEDEGEDESDEDDEDDEDEDEEDEDEDEEDEDEEDEDEEDEDEEDEDEDEEDEDEDEDGDEDEDEEEEVKVKRKKERN